MRILLLYASHYRIADNRTGEVRSEGVTLFFHGSDNLKSRERERDGLLTKGVKPFKASLDVKDFKEKVKVVPGLYEIDIALEGGSDMKGDAQILDIEYIGACSLSLTEEKKETKSVKVVGI